MSKVGWAMLVLGVTGLVAVISLMVAREASRLRPVSWPTVRGDIVSEAAPIYVLEIVSGDWHWQHEYDWAVAEGRVKNISRGSLDHVLVQVEFEDGNGTFITTGEALTDYQPILPGQTSPWKVMATWNPEMKHASVHFRRNMGEAIPTRVAETAPRPQ